MNRKTPSRKEIEELIDRLADKTLSFGCWVLLEGLDRAIQINELDSWDIYCPYSDGKVEIKYHKTLEGDCHNIIKNLGHPIHLHDVLEQIEIRKNPTEFLSATEKRRSLEIGLVDLWRECGFTKSLQEIFLGMKWEKEQLDCTGEKSEHGKLKCRCPKFSERIVSTPSPHRDLFSFLLTLGI